jgi:hypothetical protein
MIGHMVEVRGRPNHRQRTSAQTYACLPSDACDPQRVAKGAKSSYASAHVLPTTVGDLALEQLLRYPHPSAEAGNHKGPRMEYDQEPNE